MALTYLTEGRKKVVVQGACSLQDRGQSLKGDTWTNLGKQLKKGTLSQQASDLLNHPPKTNDAFLTDYFAWAVHRARTLQDSVLSETRLWASQPAEETNPLSQLQDHT